MNGQAAEDKLFYSAKASEQTIQHNSVPPQNKVEFTNG